MNALLFYALFVVTALISCGDLSLQKSNSLFDGKIFRGWEGDTLKTWRIEDGALVGGSLTETVPHNDFLVTTGSYDNFFLRF